VLNVSNLLQSKLILRQSFPDCSWEASKAAKTVLNVSILIFIFRHPYEATILCVIYNPLQLSDSKKHSATGALPSAGY
jgi:hypothetical protein